MKILDFIKENSVSIGYLSDWYQSSIDTTVPPVWTDEHLEELNNDFFLIPKDEITKLLYIEEFEFTQRTKSLLKRHDINTLADLLNCTEEQILNWNYCGNKTTVDIKNVLTKYNLSLT